MFVDWWISMKNTWRTVEIFGWKSVFWSEIVQRIIDFVVYGWKEKAKSIWVGVDFKGVIIELLWDCVMLFASSNSVSSIDDDWESMEEK